MGIINKKQLLNSSFVEKEGINIYFKFESKELEIVDLDQDGKIVKELFQIKIIGIADRTGNIISFNSFVKDKNSLFSLPLEKVLRLDKLELGETTYYYKLTDNYFRPINGYLIKEKGKVRISQFVNDSVKEIIEKEKLNRKREAYFKLYDIPKNERHLIGEECFHSMPDVD